MAKQTGLGDNFYVGGYNVSGDINSLSSISGGPGVLDVTGIDKSARERIGGLRDGKMAFLSYFNDATGQAHDVLGDLPTADVIASYFRGTVLGGQAASIVAKQIGYDGTRADDGSFRLATEVQANSYGLQWGTAMTAGVRSDTSATNGTSVDFASAGSFGFQAFLHVFSFTGTSCTVTIQSSSDNGAGDAFSNVAGGSFTPATGRTSERIAVAGAVERYLRVVTTGTFSACTFAVSLVRNDTAVTF